MDLYLLQQRVFNNKVNRNFNITNVGKELNLMTEENGELNDAVIQDDNEEIIDALGDILVYCLGLCAMFDFNADNIINADANFKKLPAQTRDLLPYITRSIGMLAKTYKKSNQELVDKLDRRDDFQKRIGDLMGYCARGLEHLKQDPSIVLDAIITNNEIRTHEGSMKNE